MRLEVGTDFLMIKPWEDDMLRRTIRRLIKEVDKLTSLASGDSAGE